MRLFEIVDFEAQQRNVQNLKLNAKRQAEQVKAAQARLKIQKAQQQLDQSKQAASSTSPL
ncbi:MAG: hypothetical protein PHO76_07795 [Methylotenera sp.]|nr:hypothetical protein [Methylotenera sp.]MDD4924915.1 hypothetical protein [Methylotenera sp.]